MIQPNYAELLGEISALLTAPEREAFATKAIIRLSEQNDKLLAALQAAFGYMQNVAIDLQTGTKCETTIATLRDGIVIVDAAIAKAEGRP